MKKITKGTVTAVTFIAFAVLTLVLVGALGSVAATSQENANSKDQSKTVPVIDGGIGPCTADFTITDSDGKPVYDAKIKVHIAYRFMNAHKLDLEVGTNVNGKARFTGLPDKIKHGIYFYATQGDLQAEAFDYPGSNCKAAFSLALRKRAP